MVYLLIEPKLLELPLQVHDRILDPLLALVPLMLFIVLLMFGSLVLDLLLLRYPIDLLFQILKAVSQVLYDHVLAMQFLLHGLDLLLILNDRGVLACEFLDSRGDQVLELDETLHGRGFNNHAAIHIAGVFLFERAFFNYARLIQ